MTYRLVVDGNLFSRKGVFNDNLLASTINTSIINGYGDRTMNTLTLGNNTNLINFGSATSYINFVGTSNVTGAMTVNGDITVNGAFNFNSTFVYPNTNDFKYTNQNISFGLNQDDGTFISIGNPTKSNLNTNIYGSKTQISLNDNNCIESNTGTNYSYLDFHSSNSTIDYDSRISCTGGNSTVAGQGVMSIQGGSLAIPNTTDVYSKGTTANLFTNQTTGGNVIIGSNTTNTTLQGGSLIVPNNISSTTKSSSVGLFIDQTSGGNITIGSNATNTTLQGGSLVVPNNISSTTKSSSVGLFTDQTSGGNVVIGSNATNTTLQGSSLVVPNNISSITKSGSVGLFVDQTSGGNITIGSTAANTTLQGGSLVVPNNISSTTKSTSVGLFVDQTSGGNVTIGSTSANTTLQGDSLTLNTNSFSLLGTGFTNNRFPDTVVGFVGQVAFFATSTAPNGWLKCNGAQVSRTTYSVLFSLIGTLYGSGDGTTTFHLPDFRGIFLRGLDDSRGIDTGRTLSNVLQSDDVKPHNHTATDSGHSHSASQTAHNHTITDNGHTHNFKVYNDDYNNSLGGTQPGGFASDGASTLRDLTSTNGGWGLQNSTTGISINNATPAITVNSATANVTISNNTGTETRPKNYALLICIKY